MSGDQQDTALVVHAAAYSAARRAWHCPYVPNRRWILTTTSHHFSAVRWTYRALLTGQTDEEPIMRYRVNLLDMWIDKIDIIGAVSQSVAQPTTTPPSAGLIHQVRSTKKRKTSVPVPQGTRTATPTPISARVRRSETLPTGATSTPSATTILPSNATSTPTPGTPSATSAPGTPSATSAPSGTSVTSTPSAPGATPTLTSGAPLPTPGAPLPGPANTPELGSGELLVVGLISGFGVVLSLRRKRSRHDLTVDDGEAEATP